MDDNSKCPPCYECVGGECNYLCDTNNCEICSGDPNYFPTAVLTCDRNDYSCVYRTEFHMPTTNKLLYLRQCSDFDPNGFPHNITEIKYDKDGNFVEKSVYKVIEVKLNHSIPSEIFEIHPPEDYKIVDQRSKK